MVGVIFKMDKIAQMIHSKNASLNYISFAAFCICEEGGGRREEDESHQPMVKICFFNI